MVARRPEDMDGPSALAGNRPLNYGVPGALNNNRPACSTGNLQRVSNGRAPETKRQWEAAFGGHALPFRRFAQGQGMIRVQEATQWPTIGSGLVILCCVVLCRAVSLVWFGAVWSVLSGCPSAYQPTSLVEAI